jgi:hypothetical protein
MREVAILFADRLDPGSVHGQQLASVEVEPPAKQHELTEHRSEGRPVPPSSISPSSSEVRVKLRSFLLTALIRVPSTASNSRP